VVLIIKYWDKIVTGAKWLWKVIKAGWGLMVDAIRKATAWLVDKVLGLLGMIIHGAATLFGWLPGGIGDDLKKAADKFDQFRHNVNRSLTGINDRNVNVGVNFSTGTHTKPGSTTAGGRGATGGPVSGLVKGPGTGTSDQAGLFWLSNKEYVHTAAAVQHYGQGFMDAVNNRRFPKMARGGVPHPGNVPVDVHTPTRPQIQAAVMPPISELAKMLMKSGLFTSILGAAIVGMAESFVGKVPYVWGGTSPAGWDCSGFTTWIYRQFGITMPRTADGQQHWAKPISFPMAGALAFFGGADGTQFHAGHVGIVVGPNMMANAYGTGFGTINSSFASGGSFGGFGIPPNRHFARGGWINEPTLGIGLRSGALSAFGERGREYVSGGDIGKQLDALIAGIDTLIQAVDDNAATVADSIGGSGSGPGPAYAAMYGAR